jgi:solute carrier family 25 protein 39/40
MEINLCTRYLGIYWLGYERIKRLLSQQHTSHRISSAQEFQSSFIAGATAGMIAAVITTPFDVAKTRIQIQGK